MSSLRVALWTGGLVGALCSLESSAQESSWPQFLGPARDGVSGPAKLAANWPKEGPKRLWRKPVGQGFSGPIVSAEGVFLFHRLGDEERVECFKTQTGESLWSFSYPATYRDEFGFDEGPRATPTVSQGRVYAMGADGVIHCLDAASGKAVWRVDLRAVYEAPKGFFGMASSPLVEKNVVLCTAGGANGAGIVALDRNTGRLIWKALEDEASYSSPTSAVLDNKRWTFFLTRSGLSVVDPIDGGVADRFPWRSRTHASIHGATPLVRGREVFISSSYETGAALLRFDGGKLRKIWSADHVLSNHYASSVEYQGNLYGFDGRQEQGPSLACVEWSTGKPRWRKDGLGAGSITLCDGALLILLEKGELIRVKASPKGYEEQGRAQILSSGTRACPALSNGLLFAKGKDSLVCHDLTATP